MKIKLTLFAILLSGLLVIGNFNFSTAKNTSKKPNGITTTKKARPQFMPGQIRVKFKPQVVNFNLMQTGGASTGISSFDNMLNNNEITLIKKTFKQIKPGRFDNFGISRIYTLYFSEDKDVLKVATQFSKSPLLEYAEPVPIHYIDNVPNDPMFAQQDHLPQIKAPQAWGVVTGDSSVIIAIIDAGTDWEHSDLIDNIWVNDAEIKGTPGVDDDGNGKVDDFHGWDFANNDNNPTNQPSNLYAYEHGTVTAGLASARTNNNLQVAGVAWNCTIMPLKHGSDDEENAIYNWLFGLKYAVDNGAQIVNLSFGCTLFLQAEQDAINDAFSKGVLIVASAGNVLSDELHYPAAYDHVLSVTWVYPNDKIAWAATYGISVDVAAPGVELLSLAPGNLTKKMSGSSSACPVVAGLAGLIKSQHHDWGPYQIAKQIGLTADNIDDKNPEYAGELGSGRINAFRAVSEIDPPEISPKIEFQAVSITDSNGGDNDKIFDRGETGEVIIDAAHNYSISPGENFVFTLTTNDTDLTIINGENEFGFFPSDTTISVTEALTFSVNEDAKGKISKIFVGWRSNGGFSDADTFKVIVGKIPLLIVDDDRGEYPAEKLYTNILDQQQLNYAVWDRRNFGALSQNQLENFPIVVWLCEWELPTLDSLDQRAIMQFLDNGGNFFVSGQDIGWDLADATGITNNQYSESTVQFFHNYLHAVYFADDCDVNEVVGMPNDPIGNDLRFQVYQPGLPDANQYPDEIAPADGASSCFEYIGGQNHKFGIKYKGDHKVVYFGMGLEAIDSRERTPSDDFSPTRTEVMKRVLNWLNFIDVTPIASSENIGDPSIVNVQLNEKLAGADVLRIELYWKKENDAEFQQIVMTDNGNGKYSAEIPGPEEITNTDYYFKMVNTYYDWENPIQAPEKYYSYYTGPDQTAPAFNHSPLISTINSEVGRELLVGIQDNSAIDTNNVYLHFSSKTTDDSLKLFTTNNPQQFRGIMPPVFAYGDTVQYYFTAYDKANIPNQGISETYSFVVGLENFESGLSNWFATPNGWGIDDLFAHSGKYSINDSPGQAPYPDNRYAIIMSNFGFDLSNCNSATLIFWTKYYIEINSDYGYVEASNNGGATWHQIGEAFNGFKVNYHEQTLSLNDFCGAGNSNVKLRFRFVSDAQTLPPLPGWFIDDIQIIEGMNVTHVAESTQPTLPDKFALYQNYPNPFNPRTTISFDLPEPGQVTLTIFNITGELVRTLIDKQLTAGVYKINWNGKNSQKLPLASGVYFYRLAAEKFSSVKKLIFLK